MILTTYIIIILAFSILSFVYETKAFPLIILTLPLFFKLKLGTDIYLHPTVLFIFLMISGYLFKCMLQPDKIYNLINEVKNNTLLKAIFLFLFLYLLYFGMGTLIFQNFDSGIFLRFFLYGLGFSVLPLAIYSGKNFDDLKFRRFLKLFIIISIIASAYSLYFLVATWIKGSELVYGKYSLSHVALGTFGQYVDSTGIHIIPKGAKTQFGLYLTILISIIFSLLISKDSIFKKWFLWIAFIINSICIIFTASRLVWFVYFLILIIMIYKTGNFSKRIILLSGLGFIFILIFYLFPNNYITLKLSNTFKVIDGHITFLGSAGERLNYWNKCLELGFSNFLYPFLGMGVINIKKIYNIVPESLFLWFWMQMGVIGILMLALIWHQIFRTLKRLTKTFQDNTNIVSHISLGLYVFSIGWLFDALFAGGDFLDITLMVPFWGTLGLLIGYYKHEIRPVY